MSWKSIVSLLVVLGVIAVVMGALVMSPTKPLPGMGEDLLLRNSADLRSFVGEMGNDETDDEFASFVMELDGHKIYLDVGFPEGQVFVDDQISVSVPDECDEEPCGGTEYLIKMGDDPDAVFVKEGAFYRLKGTFNVTAKTNYSQGIMSHSLAAAQK